MRARLFLIAGFLSVFAGSALAEPAQYSIPWFEMDAHNGARMEMIKLCRDNHRYYHDAQTVWMCENAETAQSRREYARIAGKLNSVNTLAWWQNNRDLRFSTLEACKRRAPYDRDLLQYCNLAEEAERSAASNYQRRRG